MGDVYGYARVSTRKQVIDRQVENITRKHPNAIIIREVYSGKQIEGRKELAKLLKKVQKGDTIVFDEISRMSRNRDEGYKLYMDLYERGVELEFLKEPHLDTEMYRDKIQNQISLNLEQHSDNGEYRGAATDNFLKALADALNRLMRELIEDSIALALDRAQKEREYLVQRTIEGLTEAKAKHKTLGRPKGSKCKEATQKELKAKEAIRKHSPFFGGALSETECIKLSGVSKRTYYKYRAELLVEKGV